MHREERHDQKTFNRTSARQLVSPTCNWRLRPRHSAEELKVLSEKTITGFGHVESVAYDPKGKVFYTSDFGPDLKPADKDGKGQITKVSAGRQNSRAAVPSRQGPDAQQAERHLDHRQPAVGDRHRLGLGVRSQDQGRQEARAARHPVRQRSDGDGRRALCQRQPLRSVVPRRAGRFPEIESRAQDHRGVQGQRRVPQRTLSGQRRLAADGRLRGQGQAARHLFDGARQGAGSPCPTRSACSTASIK